MLSLLILPENRVGKALHQYHLENSPFKEQLQLSKAERKAAGLPPNKYNEMIYELTMDPQTGRPTTEVKIALAQKLADARNNKKLIRAQKAPGQEAMNPWYSIGPNNHAGRTRAALFDLNDSSDADPYDKVIAGGVSGGLWINNDINNPTPQDWIKVTGVPGDLAVSVIVQDPDNPNTLFAGTGESYTSGDVVGNGIYRSTDGGSNWTRVLGSGSITNNTYQTNGTQNVDGYFYVNDLQIWDSTPGVAGGTYYLAALGAAFATDSNNFGDTNIFGLYYSTDGTTWTRATGLGTGGNLAEINDIEVSIDNKIWVVSNRNIYGNNQGTFYYSTNGTSFTAVSSTWSAAPSAQADRVEFAPSQQNTDTFYVLVSDNNQGNIFKTTNSFTNLTALNEPNDADTGIPATDFTRNQAFYDLEVEVDPSNDDIVYVGGIDWFRSQDGGTSWSQITRWNSFISGSTSVVHADQHGLYFRPGNSNQAIVVNDGGVAYTPSLSTASSTQNFIETEKNFVTLQVYKTAQTPAGYGSERILAGSQDNGTHYFSNAATATLGSTEIDGGDGGFTYIDQVNPAYIITNYVYNDAVVVKDIATGQTVLNTLSDYTDGDTSDDQEGAFINPGALDSNLDILYVNARKNGVNRIRRFKGLTTTPSDTYLTNALISAEPTAFTVSANTTNTTKLLVGLKTGDLILMTNADSTPTYSDITPTGALGSVSDIQFGATDNDIYLTYSNYGVNNIWYTSNGGTSWSQKDGDLPNLPVFSIQHNPYDTEEVILGTELGTWGTTNFSNASPNWNQLDNGMSDVKVTDLVYRGTSNTDNRVVAASYGRGLYVGSFIPNNTAPVAVSDTVTITEGGTLNSVSTAVTSVLSNDTDAENDALTATLISNPSNGIITFSPSGTGSFTYVHNGSETTTDSFTYRANDGTVNSNIATVTINISPVNDCPTVVNPLPTVNAQEDDPDTTLNITNVFVDAEGNPLTYTVTNTNPTLLTATVNTTTLTLDYMDDETGTATVTLMVNDNNGCSTATHEIFINVIPQNDPPVGVSDVIYVFENGTATMTTVSSSLLDNDTDMENDALSVNNFTNPQHHQGSFSVQSSGTFTYVHDGSETTTDSFTYDLTDTFNPAVTVAVTINVTPTNDCPTIVTPLNDVTVQEDDPDTLIDLNTIFDDVDSAMSYTVSTTNTSLVSTTLSAATLTLDYQNNQSGSATITVFVDDNAGCTSVQDSFLLTVTTVNDPPVANPESLFVFEAGTVTSTTMSNTSLLDNDTDAESLTLTATLVSTPTHGTLNLNADGTFSYVHDGSETTTDSFTYQAFDGMDYSNTTTVTINIQPVNDCPTVTDPNPMNWTWGEDSSLGGYSFNYGTNLLDPDNTAFTYTVTYTNSTVVSITETSAGNYLVSSYPNEYGSATGTFTITDIGGGGGCTITHGFIANVTPINDCPTLDNPVADVTAAQEDDPDLWIDIRNTFSDIESSTLTYSATSMDPNLIAVSTTSTSLVIDFQDNAFGSTSIVLTTSDGDMNCTVDDLLAVTVLSVNDVPNAQPDVISLTSGSTVNVLNDGVTNSVLANDTEDDGDSFTAELVNNVVNGTLSLQANGNFTYTHDGSATTTDSFTYRGRDSAFNAPGNTTTVTIYINNPPVGGADSLAVMEAGTTSVTTNGNNSLLFNDNDVDGDALTAVKITDPTNGTVVINSNGTFSYTHDGSNMLSDSFTYSPNDGKINGAPVTVSITVTGTNDPPVAGNDTIIVPLGGTATTLDNGDTSLIANDSDPDGDTVSATLVTTPNFGTVQLNPGGTFSYVQNGTVNNGDSFTYKINDGTVDSNIATVDVFLTCSPCTESIIKAGNTGLTATYQNCECNTINIYIPKGKSFKFCHLANSITVVNGSYTLISQKSCN